MKKKLIIIFMVVLAICWGGRFYILNKNVDVPIVQVFAKGEQVAVEKDFFDYAKESMDGYTVTVLDAELLSVQDFLKKYDAMEQAENLGIFTDYIYTVHVSIANEHNPYTNEKGIPACRYLLQGVNYTLSFEDTCYQIANPDMPGSSFSLREGTSMEMILTFDVMSKITSIEHLSDDIPKLVITLYPHKKMIKLY